MLMRVSGGTTGIREYLENGRKEGREFGRDELDTRVPLAGDLALTHSIINSMQTDGEKYLHVTLSFREDEIKRETLEAITNDFESFAFSAFQGDEFNYYAEAHLPRRTSYTHAGTGELIERKPHIHIVIPERNLLSGQHLNPFGKVDQQTAFLEAFQEHVNAKYGLASPKDHRRSELTPASEMISRYKGDTFQGAHRELKEQLLDGMLDRRIESVADFRAMLAEHGDVRTRNAGKSGEYLNLKAVDADKGVNLKESVFSREFIELPTDEKRARLQREAASRYEVAQASRPTPAEINGRLNDWHELRAKEIKYLNSGNRKVYAAYRDADGDTRRSMLAERESAFYAKHRKEQDHEQRSEQRGRVADIEHNLRAASRHLESASRVDRNPERAGRKFADRRAIRAVATALNRRGGDQKAPWDKQLTERQPGSVVEGFQREARERRLDAVASDRSEFATIKQQMDARHLLAHLSHTHGVIPEQYTVTKGKDGGDRIQRGARNLNVSDFLTKELNLPWKDAAPVLREAYAAQTQNDPATARETPRKELWREYREQWQPQQRKRREKTWEAQRGSESNRRAELKTVFYAKRSKFIGNRAMTPEERRAAMSVARMEKIVGEQELRDAIKAEREAIRAEFQKPHTEQYQDFLTEKAQGGNVEALDELRRQTMAKPRDREDVPALQAPTVTRPQIPPFQAMEYQVHRNGDVTYSDKRGAVLRDEARRVSILRTDAATTAAGLRLAQQKFYNPKAGKTVLVMSGSEEFKRYAVEVAVKHGIAVEFSDKKLETYRKELEERQRAGREYLAAQRKVQITPPNADSEHEAGHEATRSNTKQQERAAGTPATAKKKTLDRPKSSKKGPDFSL